MRFPVEVFWSDEDRGFIAIAPDLPGCSAWGASEAEAIRELRTAIDLWVKAAKKLGNPVPAPTDRSDADYSGRFLMRVPKRLHADLARSARLQGASLNQYVLYLLTKGQVEAVPKVRGEVVPKVRGEAVPKSRAPLSGRNRSSLARERGHREARARVN